jgi:hypothetical protein
MPKIIQFLGGTAKCLNMKFSKMYLRLFLYISFFLSILPCGKLAAQETAVEQEVIRAIETFYMAYTTNILSGISSNDLLVRKFLTKRLTGKIDRIRTATGSDPIIRAQDFREEAIETLKVKHLDGNWYMVSYDWAVDNNMNHTDIPLRITATNGQYMIDYITPEWNGTLYGDSLLCDDYPEQKIDESTPLSLVRTFYKTYTSVYCSMQGDLNYKIAELRSNHLTNNALSQFDEYTNEYTRDGYKGYDLLINYFDFDCMWVPSMKFTQLDENTCQMCYTKWDDVTTITLKVIKQDKEYRIDGIIPGI